MCAVQCDDEALQDEVLQVKLWDHDTIGNDNVIGSVFIDLNPLVRCDGLREV